MAAFEEKASETKPTSKSKAVYMLFDREILDSIMQHPEIFDKYQGYSLFNRDDMLEHVAKEESSIERIIYNGQNMCKTLNEELIKTYIIETFKPNSGYEILFIMKDNKMVGFLIARIGACARYPGQYMIDFVCTSVKGISSLLLGACMFAIKTKTMISAYSDFLSTTIMLSCANGFDNPAAYCSYRKMGFAIDHQLFVTSVSGVTCIEEHIRDLPMSVDVHSTTTDDIVQLMVTSSLIKDPMCDRRLSLEALVKVVDGSKALADGSTKKLREYIKYIKGKIDINPQMLAFLVYGNMETRDVRVRLLMDSVERGFIIYPYALLELLNGCTEVVTGGKKKLRDLIKLREKIVLLHKMDYTLRLAFAKKDYEEARKKKSPYRNLLGYIFGEATGSIGSKKRMEYEEMGYIYYEAFLEIVEDAKSDDRFNDDKQQQDLLESVDKIFKIQKKSELDEEELDEEMKNFHGMYKKPLKGQPETNCLLIKIAEKIQLLFGEYLREYSILTPSTSKSKSPTMKHDLKTGSDTFKSTKLTTAEKIAVFKTLKSNSQKRTENLKKHTKYMRETETGSSGGKRRKLRKTKRAKKQSKKTASRRR